MHSIKTVIFLGALTGLLLFVGGFVGGKTGVVIAFIFAVIMNLGAYWFSDKIVLKMYNAREVNDYQAPEIYTLVRDLAQKAFLPMPRVFIIEEETPNAFATGRNESHAVVAVTSGILKILSRDELEGVIAHELMHIKNKDMLIGSIAATLAGAIVMLANMAQFAAIFGGTGHSSDEENSGSSIFSLILMAILAPIAATLIQMAVSRSREYMADKGAAKLCGKSSGLANALEKLSQASMIKPLEANPSTAHLFIVNPLTGRRFMNLFSTHPPIEERISRLRLMRVVL